MIIVIFAIALRQNPSPETKSENNRLGCYRSVDVRPTPAAAASATLQVYFGIYSQLGCDRRVR